METVKLTVAIAAVLISVASFVIAQRAAARAKKAQAITHLLGEKETVAFAALKLLQDGLPTNKRERTLIVAALLQASVFEGSDRARALLYRVIELNRAKFGAEFRTAFRSIKDTFESMKQYGFEASELDLNRGERRLLAVEKVINAP
jgi:hypothetical protein